MNERRHTPCANPQRRVCRHNAHIACRVEYCTDRGMWRVAVYRNGAWRKDEWFHTQMAAQYYADWREALG